MRSVFVSKIPFLLAAVSCCGSAMVTKHEVGNEYAKIDPFEDDDGFEEFEISAEWDERDGQEAMWESDWDDGGDGNEDFSLLLRRELEGNAQKNRALFICSVSMLFLCIMALLYKLQMVFLLLLF